MSAPAAVTGERILVVDDEADIVALVAYHLVKAGYRVSTASTGPDALAAARQERPALVVLDLMLPGASGYEVLEKLRATPATREIAVLMLTARREEPDRIRGLALGADDYLTKPFSPQELVLRVGAILRRMGAGGSAPTGSAPAALGLSASTERVPPSAADINCGAISAKTRVPVRTTAGSLESVKSASCTAGMP